MQEGDVIALQRTTKRTNALTVTCSSPQSRDACFWKMQRWKNAAGAPGPPDHGSLGQLGSVEIQASRSPAYPVVSASHHM
jgi:hypothetical protein